MELTLLPKNRIRMTNTFIINPFHLRDIRDLYYDGIIWYRFFSYFSPLGDLIGIGLGFKNIIFGFAETSREKSYEVNYYSVYGIFDLSFLQISGGYIFDGREIFDVSGAINRIGNGFFVNAMLAWRF
jgi:hypothetical protein